MTTPYSAVPDSEPPFRSAEHTITLDDSPLPRRKSLDSSSDGSDLIYRDALDDEPFDEKDNRFTDEGKMEDGEEIGYPVEPSRLRPRKRSKRVLAGLIGVLIFAAFIGAIAGSTYSAPSYYAKAGTKHITMDHIFNGTFAVKTKTLDWVKEAPDGTFSQLTEEGNIVLAHVSNMTQTTLLVDSTKVLNPDGNKLNWTSWGLSADGEYVLFSTDTKKQWRHSSFSNFWVHRLSDSSTFPITTLTSPPKTSIAVWSPVGHSLVYVMDNDIYYVPSSSLESMSNLETIRITEDGSETIFNGVPDWVYEEEVYSSDKAIWFSPDGQSFAFLRSDETEVKEYKLQYYNNPLESTDAFKVNQYLSEVDMKYPKPGTPNPLVSVHTFSVQSFGETGSVSRSKHESSWDGALPIDERIIMEVAWVGNQELLVKEVDRAGRRGNVALFESSPRGAVVRKLGEFNTDWDDGWIDSSQSVYPLKAEIPGYLDILPNAGFNHIAFFSPSNSSDPIWITEGDWGEVTEISGYDPISQMIYFTAATPSVDRHIFSAPLPTSLDASQYTPSKIALTRTDAAGYHEASFSPGGAYYVLQYKGPEIPWQRVVEVAKKTQWKLLEGNAVLNKTLSEFARPLISRTTVISNGYTLNMLEMLPSNLDTSGRKKYPVLIRTYGGPGSQTVSNKFERDWHTYLVTEKKYIVLMIDGRGTGFKGRSLRNPVVDNLGYYEAIDQMQAAREAVKRNYVDSKRIGIWGWSYGGYLTCKVLEADSGVFTLGMAVAPPTNWMYYDSIYTERYMSTPSLNPEGYKQSAINNVTAFNKVDFLLAHGSGDDNVHYQNTASLLDKFTQERVRGWRFRMFTDSSHSISTRGAYREIYEWMTDYLDEKWGRGGTIRHEV